jgi:hypothetical protein
MFWRWSTLPASELARALLFSLVMTTATERAVEEILHTVQRLRERYDLNIKLEDYRQACEEVRTGRAVCLYGSTSLVTHWLVRIKGRTVPVIYNHKTGNIATALPLNVLRKTRYVPALTWLVGHVGARQAAQAQRS